MVGKGMCQGCGIHLCKRVIAGDFCPKAYYIKKDTRTGISRIIADKKKQSFLMIAIMRKLYTETDLKIGTKIKRFLRREHSDEHQGNPGIYTWFALL